MASLPRVSGKDKAKELRQRIDNSLDGLAKAVDDVRASETFQQFLDVQARFDKYSWHNTLLICMQRPDATQVAGNRVGSIGLCGLPVCGTADVAASLGGRIPEAKRTRR